MITGATTGNLKEKLYQELVSSSNNPEVLKILFYKIIKISAEPLTAYSTRNSERLAYQLKLITASKTLFSHPLSKQTGTN